MSDGIIGAIIGGFMALAGAWLTFRLQRREDARVMRAAILAELEAYRDAFTRLGRHDPILEMLDGWEAAGSAPHARIIAESLDMDSSVAFPVYYARVGELGLLGIADASAIVTHYSDAMGLLRSARIILANLPSDGDTSAAARQLREDYLRVVSGREALIARLRRTPVTAPAAP